MNNTYEIASAKDSPLPQKIPAVAYVLYDDSNDYTQLGKGTLQIVTDPGLEMSNHYIQITEPNYNEIFFRSRLQPTNSYMRQKSTLILITDPEQELSTQLAISFRDQVTCDIIWRNICSKIGKNFLEINGAIKLDMPTQQNIKNLISKIESIYSLVAYHVINSETFMSAFWKTVQKLNKRQNPSITSIELIRRILSKYDTKVMQVFLTDPHFLKFLHIYQLYKKENFQQYFQQETNKQKNELVQLTELARIKKKITERAIFVKQYVIDYSKDYMIENMLTTIIKNGPLEVFSVMIKQNLMPKLMRLYEQAKTRQSQAKNQIIIKILKYLLECLLTLKVNHSCDGRNAFLFLFYKQGVLKLIGQAISMSFVQAMQILTLIAQMNVTVFLQQNQIDFRNNPGTSVMRAISKQYSQSENDKFIDETISFLKCFMKIMEEEKSKFEYFNKTIIVSIFMICKKPQRILPLIEFCIDKLGTIKGIFEHIIKYNYFKKLGEVIRSRKIGKKYVIHLLKIFKLVFDFTKNEKISGQHLSKICEPIIQSGILQETLLYLKDNIRRNNLVISTFISVLKYLSTMRFNQYIKQVQQFELGRIPANLPEAVYIGKLISKIKGIFQQEKKEQKTQLAQHETVRKMVHRAILQQEQQEKYLQQDQQKQQNSEMKDQNKKPPAIFISLGKNESEIERQIMQIKNELTINNEDEQKKRKEDLKNRENMIRAKNKNKQTQFNLDGFENL